MPFVSLIKVLHFKIYHKLWCLEGVRILNFVSFCLSKNVLLATAGLKNKQKKKLILHVCSCVHTENMGRPLSKSKKQRFGKNSDSKQYPVRSPDRTIYVPDPTSNNKQRPVSRQPREENIPQHGLLFTFSFFPLTSIQYLPWG